MVDLPSCKHFEGSYYWGLAMAEKEVDLTSVGMEARVENLDSVEKVVVVVEMAMIVVDFDLEVVELVGFEKMEDIDKIEQISHKDFAYLVPMIEKDFEVGTKVVAKDSNLVGVENS